MRKFLNPLVLAGLCAVLVVPLNAQENPVGQNSNGVRIGVSATNVYGDAIFDGTDNKLGMDFGIIRSSRLSRRFGVSQEILFSSKGFKVAGTGTETSVQMSFLEVSPALVDVYFNDYFSLFLGPTVDIFLVGNVMETANGTTTDTDIDSEDMKRFSFGGVLGVQANINRLNFGLRWHLGLSSIFATDILGASNNFNGKNGGAQIMIGYYLF